MSTLAERSASETYKQFYGAVPIDQVITAKSIRVLAESPQAKRSFLFDQMDSLNNAHTELTAASLLQERFGIPLCLEAVQPFLILLSKELDAIDWKRVSGFRLFDQLQNLIQIALARLVTLDLLQRQKELELASLETTATDLQTDQLHDAYSGIAATAKTKVTNRVRICQQALESLNRESDAVQQAILELSAMSSTVSYELSMLHSRPVTSIPTQVHTLLKM